jgi:hypothetical protein
MKKQLLIVLLVILGITAYGQQTEKKPKKISKYLVGLNPCYTEYNSWRHNAYKASEFGNVQIEALRDSSRISNIVRYSTEVFKRRIAAVDKQNDIIINFHEISRIYFFPKSLIKAFCQIGILETYTEKTFEIGGSLGCGLHIGKFKDFNVTIEINQVWNTGAYNYFQLSIGLSIPVEDLFR